MDQERNERLEALDEIFGDDPFEKQRQKKEDKRQKKVDKLQAKMDKKREKLEKKALKAQEELEEEIQDEEVLEEEVQEEVAEEALVEEESAEDAQPEEAQPEEAPKKQWDVNPDGTVNLEYPEEDVPAEEEKPKKKRKKKKEKKEKNVQAPEEINVVKDLVNLLIYILILVVICWIVLTYVGQRTVVSGDSMNNTLLSGDSLWIDKISYSFSDPERFDIVVFPYGDTDDDEEETYYIKRIIGLPGETVYIDSDGNIYIDGELLEEDYGKEVIAEGHLGIFANTDEPITLGEDEYFVLGDNRNNSRDSRLSDVGNISRDDLIGKAVFRFSSEFGFIE